MEDRNRSNEGEFTAGDSFFRQMIDAGVADDQFIREIVELFLTEGGESLIQLREGFKSENSKQVKLYAHKLKSSFLMFDMTSAHQLAVKLEKSENLQGSKKDIADLEMICESTFSLLRKKYLKS